MNKYEVLQVIDEGAYGVVYKAIDKESRKYVAMKKFKEGDEDEQVRKSIQRQIKMLKLLRSPYVIELKEAFKKYWVGYHRKGRVYLIFEYMEKNVLHLLEQYQTGLPSEMILNIIYQLLKGLRMIHSRQIVHRDVKPQNLLLNSDFKLKICDFGFTRAVTQPGQQLTDYVATRWYRSPELLVGGYYAKPMDIWAVGCIMGELIDGQPMFPGQNQMDQIHLIRKMLGELTPRQLQTFSKNPRYLGLKFPQLKSVQTLQARYLGRVSKSGMSFLKSCLQMDQNIRITASQALKHPYFASIASNDTVEDIIIHSRDSKEKMLPQIQVDLHQKTPSVGKQSSLGLKTIYNANSKGSQGILRHEDPMPDMRPRYKFTSEAIKQGSKDEVTETNITRKGRLHDQHNLPRLKDKSQKSLQTKVPSQPLMINNQMLKNQFPEGPSSTVFNLSVMGQTKSIFKLKQKY